MLDVPIQPLVQPSWPSGPGRLVCLCLYRLLRKCTGSRFEPRSLPSDFQNEKKKVSCALTWKNHQSNIEYLFHTLDTVNIDIYTHTDLSDSAFNVVCPLTAPRRTWCDKEKEAIQKAFKKTLMLRLPGKREIESAQIQYPVLKSRTWRKIKDYCRNNRKGIISSTGYC